MQILEIRGENVEKCKGCANKISYISAARCSLLSIWYHINVVTYQVSLWNFETIRGSLAKPKWQKLAGLAQKICTLWFQFFGAVFASKG